LDLGCFEVENVGSQFLSLRQLPRFEHSPPTTARHKIRRNSGLLERTSGLGMLAYGHKHSLFAHFFSKALDCAESVRSHIPLRHKPFFGGSRARSSKIYALPQISMRKFNAPRNRSALAKPTLRLLSSTHDRESNGLSFRGRRRSHPPTAPRCLRTARYGRSGRDPRRTSRVLGWHRGKRLHKRK
jgi:hypothetical protein